MKIHPAWKFDLSHIELTNHTIKIKGLDPVFKGYRIVQISDFHLGTWFSVEHLKKIIKVVNGLNPNLIAITGDLISNKAEKIAPDLVITLQELQPNDAVVAVLGNHDHWTDADLIREVLMQSNVIDLSNKVYPVERNGAILYFAGVDDFLSGHDDLFQVLSQIKDGHPAILLAHEPDFIEVSAPCRRFAIQLSGHSHGGQIIFPFIGSLYLPPYGRKYPSGIYHVDGTILYTNRGLGTSWLGVRLNCPPEITLFTLQ